MCPQGKTGLTLLIDRQGGPAFTGYFHFYPLPENDRPKEGCYAVSGTIASDGTVKIIGGQWITQPPNYVTVDLQGRHNANEPSIAGDVLSQLPPDQSSGCGGFKVVRTAETANPPLMCQAKAISMLRPDPRPPAGPRASQTSRHAVATSR